MAAETTTKKPVVEIRPTVAADFAALSKNPLPFRVKAMTGVLHQDGPDGPDVDGRVIGIAGIGFRPDGIVIAFADLTEEARAHKVALHRAARRFLAEAQRTGFVRLVATGDPQSAAAQRWLDHLGFKRLMRDDAQGRPVEDEKVWVLTCTNKPAAAL